MNFAFTREQRDLRGLARDLLEGFGRDFLHEIAERPARWRELWSPFAETGLLALAVPEAAGGTGLGPVELVAVAEIVGGFAPPAPLLATMGLFVPAVAAAAGDKREPLVAVTEGVACALALPREGAQFRSNSNRLHGTRLTALCELVPDATRAELIGVVADDETGSSRLVVLPAAIAAPRPLETLDPSCPVGCLEVKGVEIDEAWVLPDDPGPGLLVGLTTAAAELIGTTSALLDLSIEHACSRKQFGVAIGSFQAVKHRLVDAHVALERSRSLVYGAAVMLADGPISLAAPAAHRAKAAASEAAVFAARTAVQVHGGLGVTSEHEVSRLYLRARQSAALLGDAAFHYREAEGARSAAETPAALVTTRG